MKYLLLLMLGIASLANAADTSPALHAYVAEYDVLRGDRVEAQATISLESTAAKRWRMHSRTRATAGVAALAGVNLDETSEFAITDTGPECRRYHYRQGGLRTRERWIDCTAGEAGISSRDHKGTYHFPTRVGVVDRQIASLALALDLAAGKHGALTVTVVDRERLEPQHYRTAGEETLDLPIGPTRTIKLERVHDTGDRATTTWFAIEHDWIPVRIVHSGKSGGYELRLRSLKR